jgi:hypothetical protein
MLEIRFDKTKDEVALLIWFLVDHSVYLHEKNMEKKISDKKINYYYFYY